MELFMRKNRTEIYLGSCTVCDFYVQVFRKDVKRYNVRIRPDGSVRLSVPLTATLSDAKPLLLQHQRWITKKRRKVLLACDKAAAQPAPSQAELASQKAWLSSRVPMLLSRYEDALGVRCTRWWLRPMVSRWGSCNVRTGRITLNTELARLPVCCLESVVVHELCHLRVANHSSAFYALMDEQFPAWRQARKIMNANPPKRASGLS
jgi:predicted metal-dependent hydrolase